MMDRSMELVSQELFQANELLRSQLRSPELAVSELEKTASVLRSTLNSTRDGMLVVSNEMTILFYNTRLLELLQIPAAVIESRDYERFLEAACVHLAEPMNFSERARGLFEEPEAETFDVLELGDGRIFERTTVPQRIDGKPVGRVLFFRDTTQRRRLEDQLRHSQKMEAVGQLAGGLAHDLNNLLTVIAGHSELLLRRCPASLSSGVKEVQKAGDRAGRLVKRLLAFSRKQVLETAILDLNAIVSEMTRMLHRLIGEDIELVVDLGADLGHIKADSAQVEQVVLNLAVNARDAMPAGGTLAIETKALSSLGQISLTVTDSGCGMSPEVQSRIFEPFFTTKEQGQGTGLGLATVFGIVAQSGGTIEVESTLGQGSRFEVRFPVAAEPLPEVDLPPDATAGSGNETILIAEDEEPVRKLLALVLQDEGYQILCARDGNHALDLARGADRIDLLLTDVVMPGIRGPELARLMREERPDLRCVFMSGHLDDADRSQPLEGPLLHKPFKLEELPGKIRAVLDDSGYVTTRRSVVRNSG